MWPVFYGNLCKLVPECRTILDVVDASGENQNYNVKIMSI